MVGFYSLLLVFMLHLSVNASGDFDYEKKGPSQWPQLFGTCIGVRQSPIDIITKDTIYDSNLPQFSIISTSKQQNFTLTNDGHKINLKVPAGLFQVKFASDFNYEVASLHWHWGKIDGQGSEHTIDGKSGPIELHIVTWNTRIYKSFEEAASQPNGLAVIGLMYQVHESNSVEGIPKSLTDAFAKVQKCDQCSTGGSARSTPISYFNLAVLLPSSNIAKYYRYDGSLTTPPCTENVMWTLLVEAKGISKSQLNHFRNLLFPDGKSMVDNYRPPQKLNPGLPISSGKRQVLRSFQ